MRIRRFFQKPGQVFLFCLAFLLVALIANGALWRLWNLHREYNRLQSNILLLQEQTQKFDQDILKIKDPNYIERQARDRLDLVSKNDLVFVFPAD